MRIFKGDFVKIDPFVLILLFFEVINVNLFGEGAKMKNIYVFNEYVEFPN